MSKEKEQEKIFSEEVDRLISGQETKSGDGVGPEVNSALDFARKMTLLRTSPSTQFSIRLKEKLLRQMEAQEVGALRKEKRDWFSWLVLHKPVWQAATAVFVIMVVIGITWAVGVFDTGPVPVVSLPTPALPMGTAPAATTPAATVAATTKPLTTAAATVAPATTKPAATTSAPSATTAATPAPTFITGTLLAAGASTDKTAYIPGEVVKINFTLKNVSLQPLMLEKLPPVVSLMQTDTRQPVYTFRAGKESRILAPGETAAYTLTWNQFDFNNRQISTGSYYVELEDLDYQGRAVQLNLSTPVRFDILPPDAMATKENILVVNQSQTAGGITITLQKIELLYTSIKIYAFVTPPPDYTLMQGASGLIPARDYNSQAVYSINGAAKKDAGVPEISAYSNGMNFSWFPIKVDFASARELVFTINQIGIWTGPWQFNIPLK